MEDNIKDKIAVKLLLANKKLEIAIMGLKAIIEQSADISSNRRIAETTIEHIDKVDEVI
jgi:hypothetical protein